MLRYTTWEPPVLLAQIMYIVLFCTTIGRPDMFPFAPRVIPSGISGETSHDTISPPVTVDVTLFITVLLTSIKSSTE